MPFTIKELDMCLDEPFIRKCLKKVKSIFKGTQPIHSCPPVTATLSKLRKHGGHVDSVLFCADHELYTLTRRDVRQSTNGRYLLPAYLWTVGSHGVGVREA
ncbi:hypothetical protein Bca4012_093230 [Brassica carinata]